MYEAIQREFWMQIVAAKATAPPTTAFRPGWRMFGLSHLQPSGSRYHRHIRPVIQGFLTPMEIHSLSEASWLQSRRVTTAESSSTWFVYHPLHNEMSVADLERITTASMHQCLK